MIRLLLLVALAACGRYAPPVAPEYLAPSIVNNPTMTLESGARLNWVASSSDVRGKKLKTIDGYEIYRRLESSEEFERIGFVKDSHLIELKKLQEQAKKAGKTVRKVRVAAEQLNFTYLDKKPVKSEKSIYAIVPVNNSGVKSVQIKYFLLDPKENKIVPDDFGGIPLSF